ncbi:Hypothetical protein A7982_00113 [Minicystis rosea]|nr:Hypothetical protein A7982_00113 [Minicystis rosea]
MLLAAGLFFAPQARADEPSTGEPPKAAAEPEKPSPTQAKPASAAEKPDAPESKSEPLLVIERRPRLDPPEGSAGPATTAGTTGLRVQLGLEAFVGYDLQITPTATGTKWFHNFEIPRAHASMTGLYGPVQARLVLEAVRSASEGALLGVAGDSFVMRLREASAGYRLGRWLAIDAGVVPTLTIPELDGTFALRAVAATPTERAGLGSPADLGATARFNFPADYGYVAVGAYNGEGYNQRELNRGKNFEAALEFHPAPGTFARPLAVFASFVNGSSGTGSAKANRLTTALLWQGRRIRAGADFVYAWGIGENGLQRSYLIDGFLRLEPIDRLLFGARGFTWLRDTTQAADRITEVTGAAGYRIADPLETFVAVSRTLAGERAKVALPGVDHWDVRIIGRVVF